MSDIGVNRQSFCPQGVDILVGVDPDTKHRNKHGRSKSVPEERKQDSVVEGQTGSGKILYS